jgi:hypothetical protein
MIIYARSKQSISGGRPSRPSVQQGWRRGYDGRTGARAAAWDSAPSNPPCHRRLGYSRSVCRHVLYERYRSEREDGPSHGTYCVAGPATQLTARFLALQPRFSLKPFVGISMPDRRRCKTIGSPLVSVLKIPVSVGRRRGTVSGAGRSYPQVNPNKTRPLT